MRLPGTTAVAVLAAGATLWGAGRMHPRLLEQRRASGLNQGEPLENAPPLVAFTTVALGAFRGIAVDLLWARASELQDQGRFVELVQLSDWITKLQPRFASIWAFHGWNLAYNVSVMLPDPADRWRWVRYGVALLRDDGLRYNPGSALLHRELAWMFHHKLGMDMDQAHMYYKRAWAEEMTAALGGARPDPELAELATAPATLAGLTDYPGMDSLWAELRAAGIDPADPGLLTRAVPPPIDRRLRETDEGRRLRAYHRARRLRHEFRLEPARMLDVEEKLGARLDWRLPFAHAVYWASMGLPYARNRFEDVSLRRQIFQSLSFAFLRGRLTLDTERNVMVLSPAPDLLPAVRAAYDEALRQHPADATVRQSHRNFLVDAIMVSVSFGRRKTAEELFAEYIRLYGDQKSRDFGRFVGETWAGRMVDIDAPEALAAVEAALYQAEFWREMGDLQAAEGHETIAALTWHHYMADRTDPEVRERTGLPDLAAIRRRAVERLRSDLTAGRSPDAVP